MGGWPIVDYPIGVYPLGDCAFVSVRHEMGRGVIDGRMFAGRVSGGSPVGRRALGKRASGMGRFGRRLDSYSGVGGWL